MKLALKQLLLETALELAGKEAVEGLSIDLIPPKEASHGDLSSDLGFRLAKILRQPPKACADKVLEVLVGKIKVGGVEEWIERAEVVPPGFINFFFKGDYFSSILKNLHTENESYGKSTAGGGKKIILEYVSANPTGPLTIAHGRQAVVGDTLARILKIAGYKPHKEYYMNDAGRQINLLGQSLNARYGELVDDKSVSFPEEGYQGEYLIDLAGEVKAERGEELKGRVDKETVEFFRDFAKDKIFQDIQKDLQESRVSFDEVYSEQSLFKTGLVDETLKLLKKKKKLYEKDGALWLKTQDAGDDKDRVLKKSDGSFTYLTPDIAYHRDKFARGFETIVNLWGPDHHGYIARLKAAMTDLGFDPKDVKVLLVQLTSLFRDGEPVKMSTRKGEFVTFRELMDEVGVDATRFFFLMRRIESHLDFDLEVAKKKSDDNPVFYLQYAHARICSLLAKSESQVDSEADLSLLKEKEELDLIRALGEFPDCLALSAANLEPYGVTDYLRGLAQGFHRFYTFHRVIIEDEELSAARLFLVDCCRITLRNGLSVLGISSPDHM